MKVKRKKILFRNYVFHPVLSLLLIGICMVSPRYTAAITIFQYKKREVNMAETLSSPLDHLPVIVHGLGATKDGHMVTNSLEALLYNYRLGFRVFEVDLVMTSDNRLIARHDWTAQHYQYLGQKHPPFEGPIPFDKLMSLTIHGQYHPISWEQLLEIMQICPDLYIVTDTKDKDIESVTKTFSYIVNTAKQMNPTLLERIIPQIYEPEMLKFIKKHYDFNNIILTTYQLTKLKDPTKLATWCKQNHITAVASFPFRFTAELHKELKANGILIYLHTINDPKQALNLRKQGIGIYSDYLFFNGKEYSRPPQQTNITKEANSD